METIQKLKKKISGYYLRYLMSIELYMVEPWERIVVHVLIGVLFSLFWYFNYRMIVKPIPALGHPSITPIS